LTEPPITPKLITEPFKTIYDVTDQTPVDDIPKEYYTGFKQQQKDEKTLAEQLQNGVENFSKNPDIEKLLLEQVHQTVSKFDDHIIRVVFHVGLSAYFKPLNLGLKAESGSGKSYSTLETIKFLPDEDVQTIGSQSPKVISHENGIPKTLDGEILTDDKAPVMPNEEACADHKEFLEEKKRHKEAIKEWKKKLDNCIYEVDLRNKILLFLESINLETFKMFKITMSHDKEFIDHKYVDDKGKVHRTRLIGASAMIFNSVDSSYVEEFATRTFSATPSTRAEKIEDSMRISNNKSAYPWIYEQESFNKKIIKDYIRKIKAYLVQGKIRVATPFDGIHEGFSKDATRDMRDFNKFLELLPSYAIFKLFQRPIAMIQGHRYLIPTIEDALDAKFAYDSILETTKTSTDYRIIEFYNKIVASKVNGCDVEFLADEYNKDRKHPVSIRRIREWLTRLEEIGYVDIREATHKNDKGYIDRRYNSYFPLKKKNAANTAILQTSVDLTNILQKGFEKWVKNTTLQTDIPIIILNIDGTAKPISLEEMKDIILGNKKTGSNINGVILTPNSNPVDKTKPENTAIPKIAIKAVFSRYVTATPIKRCPGIYCTAMNHGDDCHYEAEWNLNGNLLCKSHFPEQVKLCEENGTGVNIVNPTEVA
jgi:hypothetical protein